jgi:hypothetical protein
MGDMGRPPRYAAFISYSHTDEAVARWLHRKLENYTTPKDLIDSTGRFGPVPAKLGKVFRDREEFAAGGDLTQEIQSALQDSAALIVLCSPAAAESRYVHAEIEFFRNLGRGRILPVVIDGDYPQCLPPALNDGVERLAADLRETKDGRDLGSAKLLAGLLGVDLDALVQREQRRQRERSRAILGLGAAFSLLAVLASVFGTLAFQNVQRARELNALRLIDESDFLADAAIAAGNEGNPDRAIELALQALPVGGDRPFSARAFRALQGALFDSTLVVRAPPTNSPITDFALLETPSLVVAALEDGTLPAFDAETMAPREVWGRCSGRSPNIEVSAELIVVTTDLETCLWELGPSGLSPLPSTSATGSTQIFSDRVVVNQPRQNTMPLVHVFLLSDRRWRTVDPTRVQTPAEPRYIEGGLLAFDHGSHFHLIDALTRQNRLIGCLGDDDCPDSIMNTSVAWNARANRYVTYQTGQSVMQAHRAENCTTSGSGYNGVCDGGYVPIRFDGENTSRIVFSRGRYPTYVRQEFHGGFDVGNADSLGLYYRMAGGLGSEVRLSGNGRFAGVYRPVQEQHEGGRAVQIYDLLGPNGYTALPVAGQTAAIDLGETGRRALVLERSGRLALHNLAGSLAVAEHRWPFGAADAPMRAIIGDNVIGVATEQNIILLAANGASPQRNINLGGANLLSAKFITTEEGCALTSVELICMNGGQESRARASFPDGAELIALSDSGARAVILADERFVMLDTASGERLWSVAAGSELCCVRFSVSGRAVVVSYQSGRWIGLNADDGRQIYSIGDEQGTYGDRYVSSDRRYFLATIGENQLGVIEADTGRTSRNVSMPDTPEGFANEIAIDGDFQRIWARADENSGVLIDIATDTRRTIAVESQTLGLAFANFSPSGRYVIRTPTLEIGSGPEAMQIVDLDRGTALPVSPGRYSPAVTRGMLDNDIIIVRDYDMGVDQLNLPGVGENPSDLMTVRFRAGREPVSIHWLMLENGERIATQSIEFSLDITTLAVTSAGDRLVVAGVDNADQAFVYRVYEIPQTCAALRSRGEAILGRRPSPPSATLRSTSRLGLLERGLEAILGPQRFESNGC